MSKIIYLIGAEASWDTRNKKGNGLYLGSIANLLESLILR